MPGALSESLLHVVEVMVSMFRHGVRIGSTFQLSAEAERIIIQPVRLLTNRLGLHRTQERPQSAVHVAREL